MKIPNKLFTPDNLITPKMVLLNGPANTGKDELFKVLQRHLLATRTECKWWLHELTTIFFNIPESRYWVLYSDKVGKEIPNPYYKISVEKGLELEATVPSLKGKVVTKTNVTDGMVLLSPRQALIYISEVVVKPHFGKDWFGVKRVGDMLNSEPWLHVDASSAFVEEIPPLIEYVGQDNILLLRIHRTGYTFEGDSRGYLPDGLIDNTLDLWGDNGLDSFLEKGLDIVNTWCLTGKLPSEA